MATGAFGIAKAGALTFAPMMHMSEYLDELHAQGRNPDYIRTMRNGLAHFADYLHETEKVRHPDEITRHHILRFQAECNSRVELGRWAKSYSIQVLKKVRAWMNWLFDVSYIESNPWRAIKVGTVPKQPRPLEEEEVESLFAAHRRKVLSMDAFTFHRREVILTLLYAWGLRLFELEALDVHDVDQRRDFVTACNKGGGKKTLPYTQEIKDVVARWLRVRARHAIRDEDALLITTNGTRLSKEQIRTIIYELGKEAGVRINPHRLRDTCATTLLDDDTALERVQLILGHANIQQVLAYGRVNPRKVFEAHQRSMTPRLQTLLTIRSTGELAEV